MTLPAALRSVIVSDMLALQELRGGTVPAAVVAGYADEVGCYPSTVYRWLADARFGSDEPDGRRRHINQLEDSHIEVVFSHFGDVRNGKRELNGIDPVIASMSESTFRRRWLAVDPAIRAMAKEGATGLLRMQMKVLYTADARNDIWHMDHQELPVWVLPRGHTVNPVKPWLTTVEDDATRRIMATLLTVERPSAEHVAVVLADAMRTKTITGTDQAVGGVPVIVHSDNGGEFKSNHYKTALLRLGITRKLSFPYMKHQNGKVERVQKTMQDELIKGLPGHSAAPKTLKLRDLFGLDAPLLDEDALVVLVDEWVDCYNNERPHQSLGGLTPDQAWCQQDNPLREAELETLRLALLASDRASYKVQPVGVSFNNRYYTAPEFATRGLVGRQVQVRYMPSDDSFIEVFADGKWVCTALLHADLTDEQRDEIKEATRDQYTRARAYHAAAAERRKTLAAAGQNGLPAAPSVEDDTELGASDEDFLRLVDPSASNTDDPQDTPGEDT